MDSFLTDTQALVKFMMGKKVINDRSHQAYLSADRGESIIIIPAIVLMEMFYLFEKNRIEVGLLDQPPIKDNLDGFDSEFGEADDAGVGKAA